MRRAATRGRVYGPYEEPRGGWRVVVVNAKGERTSATFAREREAREEKLAAQRELEAEVVSVSKALDIYRDYQVAKGNKPRSISTTQMRLRSLFPDPDECLVDLNVARCQRLYDEFAARTSVDTHRNTRNEGATFLRWAVKRGYLLSNPLEQVEGVGRRKRGKPQLRIDEARAYYSVGYAMAEAGVRGALAALMPLALGMRSGEILGLKARDVDDGGRVLWVAADDVDEVKTELGRRTLVVSDDLAVLLEAAAEEGGHLFPTSEHQWLNREVAKVCYRARVPRVCPHGLRGTHSSLAVEFGSSSLQVASALGHTPEVNREHYTKSDASAAAASRRVTLRLKE